MVTHRAFVAGQRDKNSETDRGMVEYIEDWDKRWEALADDEKPKGKIPSLIDVSYLQINWHDQGKPKIWRSLSTF